MKNCKCDCHRDILIKCYSQNLEKLYGIQVMADELIEKGFTEKEALLFAKSWIK